MGEYKYSINLNIRNRIMLIDDQIGVDDLGKGIDESQFMRELLALDQMGFEDITLMINSYGGYVSAGQQIFSTILNCKTKIKTQVMGVAASIAAVIFEAGNQRIVNDYSILMFHDPSGGSEKSLDVFKEAIIAMCGKTKLPKKKISDIMSNETWINGNDSKYSGVLWDVMLETNRVINLNNIDMVMNSGKEIIDQIKNENDMDLRIKEKLDLSINSTDEDVLNKIDELKTKNEIEIEISESEEKPEMTELTIKNNLKIAFECFETGKPIFTMDEAGNLTQLAPGTYEFLDEERTYTYSKSFVINELGEVESISENDTRLEKAMNITIDKLVDVINIEVKNEDIQTEIENIVEDIIETETITEEIKEEKDTNLEEIAILNSEDNEKDIEIENLKQNIELLKEEIENIKNTKNIDVPVKGIDLKSTLKVSNYSSNMASLMEQIKEKNKIK